MKLIKTVTNISEAFKISPTVLENFGVSEKIINDFKKPPWDLIEKENEWLSQKNHHLVTFHDSRYPSQLKEIFNPPLALFINGKPDILTTPQIAMVGSRQATPEGLDNAYQFAKSLAKAGLTITSGLALGIDAESHRGALDAKGKTIAVLGTGIDEIYPKSNSALAHRIVMKGSTVLSEFPINSPAKKCCFPHRNRIISGLSLGVFIVEASMQSGSLITARLALEQNREIFALPGSIHNPLARGCHILLRQGAKLIETVGDILDELPNLKAKKSVNINNLNQDNLDLEQTKLLDYVGFEPVPLDLLIEYSGLSSQNITQQLLNLELQGHIKSINGGYIRIR